MKQSYVISKEQLDSQPMKGGMNNQYGIQVYCSLDAEKARALLPSGLKLAGEGLGYIYVVNIREPSFAPWYMEGGIGIMTEYEGNYGVHFLGLMLSGPGALMGAFMGREGSGLPKKLCELIQVERNDQYGHCFIERGGVRLLDVELEMGACNPNDRAAFNMEQSGATFDAPVETDGGCILFRYENNENWYENLRMTYYDSPTRYYSWEPANATVALASSLDDPWADLPITGVLGGAWMISDNWVRSQRVLRTYSDAEKDEVIRYIFSGRYDRSVLGANHQIYC